jgi:hypothetical protein
MVDLHLGRFVSADTIVPNADNPQALIYIFPIWQILSKFCLQLLKSYIIMERIFKMDIKKISLTLLLLFVSVGCASPAPTPLRKPFITPYVTPVETLETPSWFYGGFNLPAYTMIGEPYTANFEVIQSYGYLDQYGSQRTIIQIRNDRDETLMIREMFIVYFDADGKQILDSQGGGDLGPVPANSLYTFEIGGHPDVTEWSEVILEADCISVDIPEVITSFEAHSVEGTAENGVFKISGQITNLSETLIEVLEIRAVLYDSEGIFVGFGSFKSWAVSFSPLSPGGTISFEISGYYDYESVIDSYELFMYGY